MDQESNLPVRVEGGALAVFGHEPPAEIIKQASERARAVADVIEQQKLYQTISGKRHVQVEGWNTLGAMYGLLPRIAWSYALDDGGWHAKAEIVALGSGAVVSSAEAECGSRGDTNWKGRSSYQQRSMAQTRAVSKAFRLGLSWVMVLAGFSPTPAEEMDNGASPKRSTRKASGQAAAGAPKATATTLQEKGIKPSQLGGFMDGDRYDPKLFWTAAAEAGVSVEDVYDYFDLAKGSPIPLMDYLSADPERTLAGLIESIAAGPPVEGEVISAGEAEADTQAGADDSGGTDAA